MKSQDLVHLVIKKKDLIHIQNKKNVLSQKKKKKKNVNHIMKQIRFTHVFVYRNLRRRINGGKTKPLNLQTLITVV